MLVVVPTDVGDGVKAPQHPHNQARGTFIEIDGVTQPAPAPRFSRTPSGVPHAPAEVGQHTDEVLSECGFSEADIADLKSKQAI